MPSRKITLSLGAASLIATVFSLPMLLQAQDHEEAPMPRDPAPTR